MVLVVVLSEGCICTLRQTQSTKATPLLRLVTITTITVPVAPETFILDQVVSLVTDEDSAKLD